MAQRMNFQWNQKGYADEHYISFLQIFIRILVITV